jgi:hypothetical protein
MTSSPAFGSAYTLYGAGTPYAPIGYANYQYLIDTDTGVNNRVSIYRDPPSGKIGGLVQSSSTVLFNPLGAVDAAGVFIKGAIAGAASDYAFDVNGGAIISGVTAGTMPATTQVQVGNFSASAYWDGDITEFAIWPANRVTNSGLTSGTT